MQNGIINATSEAWVCRPTSRGGYADGKNHQQPRQHLLTGPFLQQRATAIASHQKGDGLRNIAQADSGWTIAHFVQDKGEPVSRAKKLAEQAA